MIDFRAACLIIEREMNLSFERPESDRSQRLRVFAEYARELDWGWVIYFGDSYSDFDEKPEALASKYPPCLVNRHGGQLFSTGKSWTLKKYIGDFKMQLIASGNGHQP